MDYKLKCGIRYPKLDNMLTMEWSVTGNGQLAHIFNLVVGREAKSLCRHVSRDIGFTYPASENCPRCKLCSKLLNLLENSKDKPCKP